MKAYSAPEKLEVWPFGLRVVGRIVALFSVIVMFRPKTSTSNRQPPTVPLKTIQKKFFKFTIY